LIATNGQRNLGVQFQVLDTRSLDHHNLCGFILLKKKKEDKGKGGQEKPSMY
jgi:hypothetical protein